MRNKLIENILEELRYRRKVKNQMDFGKKLGYSKGYVSEVLNGSEEITELFLGSLKDVFGISPEYVKSGGKKPMFASDDDGVLATDPVKKLGQLILVKREEHHYSQTEVVELLKEKGVDISQRTLASYELGALKHPKREVIKAISQVLESEDIYNAYLNEDQSNENTPTLLGEKAFDYNVQGIKPEHLEKPTNGKMDTKSFNTLLHQTAVELMKGVMGSKVPILIGTTEIVAYKATPKDKAVYVYAHAAEMIKEYEHWERVN